MTLRTVACAVVMAVIVIPAHAITANFQNIVTSSQPSLTVQDVTITGSANVVVLNFSGLGISGEASSFLVDGTEFINFAFSAPVLNVSYNVPTIGCDGTGCQAGQRSLEVFGEGGGPLGTFMQAIGGDVPLSSLIGGIPIESFRLTSTTGSFFRVGSVTYEFAPISTVPLPAALPLFASGLAAIGFIAWRRKRRPG